MRALQIVSRGKLDFVETDKPELEPGHVLIRPRYVGLCGSDVWMSDFAPEDTFPRPPGTTGHEVIGTVEAISGDHPSVSVGDMTLAIAPDHRGLAELYLAPIRNVLPLPKCDRSPEELLMAQQLGTVIFGCKYLPSIIGKTVAVVGQGSAGLWFNFMLRRLGARRVVALDTHEHRRGYSEIYGATHVVDATAADVVERVEAANGGEPADIVVEAAGRESSINLSFRLAKKHSGFLLQFGIPRPPFTIDYSEMFFRCLTVKSIVGASIEPEHDSTLEALDLIASGAIDVSRVITHRLAFDDALKGFDLQRTAADGALKTVIEML